MYFPSSEEIYKYEIFSTWWHDEEWGNPLWFPQECYLTHLGSWHSIVQSSRNTSSGIRSITLGWYHFQQQWLRAWVQLIWSVGVLLGQGPKRNTRWQSFTLSWRRSGTGAFLNRGDMWERLLARCIALLLNEQKTAVFPSPFSGSLVENWSNIFHPLSFNWERLDRSS